MSYPSKTFKMNVMFRMLYHSCMDVVNRDKSPLTIALLEKDLGKENAAALQLYDFNELIEKMIMDLKEKIAASSYDDVAFFVYTHERYSLIKDCFDQKDVNSRTVMLSFRISEQLFEEVHKLKENTLGAVVELAIGLYVLTCDEFIFNYILLAYQYQ